MSSKRRLRRLTERHKVRSCESKQRFPDKTAAVRAMIAAGYAFSDHTMATYLCRFCGDWHFGHKSGQ